MSGRKNKKHDLEAIKLELLMMAALGERRPSHAGHPLGKVLTYLCCRSHSYFDEAFSTQIKNVRPDWFDPDHWYRRKPEPA